MVVDETVLAQNKVGVFQVRRESKNKEGATGDEEQNQDDNNKSASEKQKSGEVDNLQ